jgi:hypothetical protein
MQSIIESYASYSLSADVDSMFDSSEHGPQHEDTLDSDVFRDALTGSKEAETVLNHSTSTNAAHDFEDTGKEEPPFSLNEGGSSMKFFEPVSALEEIICLPRSLKRKITRIKPYQEEKIMPMKYLMDALGLDRSMKINPKKTLKELFQKIICEEIDTK